MRPEVNAFFDPQTYTYSYVVTDPQTSRCALVDSVLDYDSASGHTSHESADKLIEHVRSHDLTVEWILETHVHADHLSAAPYLREKLGGKLAIGEKITVVQQTFSKLFNTGPDFSADGSQFDALLVDGAEFKVGNIAARVMHTPGHTPACLTYVIGDAAFVGDTLFMPDYGTARCDFPGGDTHAMYHSVQKIFTLPDATRMFLCHDYGTEERKEFVCETTVGEQKRHNVHIHAGVSEQEFVSMRDKRDATLGTPKLMLPSVQVNMRAGNLPPAEANGIRYLKIPLNVL
ncbi:MAG: MBL fold metallo-hydrolase [Gammaproteobacteria bacterium]|nr:MBL fold metallo-hydrolase [Gammaproteobacteria bacterium]